MKNNKYAPYILGPIVIVIWGTIFYKIYQAIYGQEDFDIPTITQQYIPKDSTTTNKYQLLLNYKDPFTGKRMSSASNKPQTTSVSSRPSSQNAVSTNKQTSNTSSSNPRKRPNNNKAPQVSPENTPSTPMPTIKYQGFQSIDGDTVALVRIDGRFYPNVRLGQELRGCLIDKITEEELYITFGQTKKVIRRADS